MPRKPAAAASVLPTVPPASAHRPATVAPSEPPPSPPDAGLPADESLDAWLTLGGAENRNTVAVYRASESGAPEYLFTSDASTPPDALMARVRSDYGAGQYRFQVREGGRIVRNTLIGIAAEPVRGEIAAAPAVSAPAPFDMSQFLLQQLTAQQQQNSNIIAAVIGRPTPPGSDWAKILVAAAPLAAPLIAGIVDVIKGAKPDPLDIVEKVAKIRELMGAFGGDNEGAGNRNVFDVLTEGMKTFGPLLQAAAAGSPDSAMGSAPRAIAAPGEGGQPPPAINRQNTPENHPLRVLLRTLIAAAAKNGDPATYANFIGDQWPGTPEQLESLIANPQWLEFLARFEPQVKAYAPWFESVRAVMVEPGEEEGAPAGDEASAG